MRMGFGWSSKDSLRELCCTLWAKSLADVDVISALFERLDLPEWDLNYEPVSASLTDAVSDLELETGQSEPLFPERPDLTDLEIYEPIPATQPSRSLPPIETDDLQFDKKFIFAPNFPLTRQEVTRQWRTYNEKTLAGPPVEIDVTATIELRCRQGVPGPIILKPRKTKSKRTLLLVDCQGSMNPFAKFVEVVQDAIRKSVRSNELQVLYFHDAPVEGADETVLGVDQPFPVLDNVLDDIVPLEGGFVYEDRELLSPVPLAEVLQKLGSGGLLIFISDGGAARRRYDPERLLDTIAFIKVVRKNNQRYVWLNPLPSDVWQGTTAEQLARHVPMFALNSEGLLASVKTLRSQRQRVECPV